MSISMHLLVLASACASALSLAIIPTAPPYQESLDTVDDIWDILDKNVLSMDGNVPLLNDPRRHYAEIIHVIYYEAEIQSGCLHDKYSKDFQTNLNKSAPEAINDPEAVIAKVQKFIEKFNEKTKELQALVRSCDGPRKGCDKVIEREINKNIELYGPQTNALILNGKFAAELKNKHATFNEVAKYFGANEFIINGVDDLQNVTLALADVYSELNQWRPGQVC